MELKPITAITVLLLLVASLSIAGCTTAATDYSDYYNKYWEEAVVLTKFSKDTSSAGNDRYMGVIRGASKQSSTTVVMEHADSQDKAAQLYKAAVAKAKSDGYKERAFNKTAESYVVERWQGDMGFNSYISLRYYNNPDVKSWVFEKQYM
jgi:hypothetical protein